MPRKLTSREISELENRGCTSSNWSQIDVDEGFMPSSLYNVQFAGPVCIGPLGQNADTGNGIFKQAGIRNCYIENCAIGSNVYISNVTILANYNISDNVVIENCGFIVVEGDISFGNGIEIEVFNEGGGREIIIFDRLTA